MMIHSTTIKTRCLNEPNEPTRITMSVVRAVYRELDDLDPRGVFLSNWMYERMPYGASLMHCVYWMYEPCSALGNEFPLIRAPALRRRMLVS